MESNYLKLARQAREENNSEDAKRFYDMARVDDPENLEAKYYYAYYNLKDAINIDVPDKFFDYLKVAGVIAEKISNSSLSSKQKIDLLGDIISSHIAITYDTWHHVLFNCGVDKIYDFSTCERMRYTTILSIAQLGYSISINFKGNKEALNLAAICWKKVCEDEEDRKIFYNRIGDNQEERDKGWDTLISAIKNVEPSFVAPEKPAAGISCGSK